MKPVSSRRLLAVMAPTVAAVLAVALIVGPQYPFAAFLFMAGILAMSSAALPAPAWIWWMTMPRRTVRALARRGLKPPRGAVIITVCIAGCLAVDVLVFPRSIPAGLALLGALFVACCAAIWSPEWAWLADWRERALAERFWNRRLRAMDAHDREDFSGKGIPRKDWAAFNDALAEVLREMRASEGRGK